MNVFNYARNALLTTAVTATTIFGSGCNDNDERTQCAESIDVLLEESEKISDVKLYIDNSDLPSLEPFITRGVNGRPVEVMPAILTGPFASANPDHGAIVYGKDERDVTGHYLFFNDGDAVFELDFDISWLGLDSTVDPMGSLTDIIGQKFNVLGKEYHFADATTDGTGIDLKLLGGEFAVQDINKVGEYGGAGNEQSQLPSSGIGGAGIGAPAGAGVGNGPAYRVEIVYADPMTREAGYVVNGEFTGVMKPGDIAELASGKFGHESVLDSAAGIVAQFALNANTLRWQDESLEDAAYAAIPVEHDGRSANDGFVRVDGEFLPDGSVTINRMWFRVDADAVLGDMYIGAGKTLQDIMDDPNAIPGRRLNVHYLGRDQVGSTYVGGSGAATGVSGAGSAGSAPGNVQPGKHRVRICLEDK